MKFMSRIGFTAAAILALAAAKPAMAGTTYKFTITCGNRSGVAQWNTGDIDPGKEYLRVATGTNNPGCSVSDFNPASDGWMPVTTYEGPAGVVQGIPLVGQVLENIFGF